MSAGHEGESDGGFVEGAGVATGSVDEGSGGVEIDEVLDAAFVAHGEEVFEHLGLFGFEEFGDRNESVDVGKGVVGGEMFDIVGFGEEFEAIGGFAFGVGGPIDAFGAEGANHADDVKEVPLAAVVFPLPFVGVVKIAPEEVADELIVETDGVVANGDGAGGENVGSEIFGEFVFGEAVGLGLLGGDAGGGDGEGAGEGVVGEFDEEIYGVAEGIEIKVGALAGELHNAVFSGG